MVLIESAAPQRHNVDQYLADKEGNMFKHLLLAVDGTPFSDAAFRKALLLAQELKARITALRVCPDYRVLPNEVETLPETREHLALAARQDVTNYLAGIEREAAAAGGPCETTFLTHAHPYEAIVRTAHETGCDLIVMASHGRRGVQALLIGSETQKVLTHSQIPVLVYR